MKNNENHVEYAKRFKRALDKVSPSFCMAKWMQVTLHLHNGYNHSCHHPKSHRCDVNELKTNPSALHNTQYKKEVRQQMLDGERPPECAYCWNVEDTPGDHISDRIWKSESDWSVPYIEKVVNAEYNEDINPTYVEVSFSNQCNFKCAYCSASQSSKWVEEAQEFGPYPTVYKFNDLSYFASQNTLPIHHSQPNPYVDAFWEWWPNLVKDLEVFRITGGEPLLHKDLYKFLDYIDENPMPDLEFSVNTNAGVSQSKFVKFVARLKKIINEGKIGEVMIFTSMESAGKQAEYVRFGLNYNQWLKNIEYLLQELPTVRITVMAASNALSILSTKDLVVDMFELNKKYSTPEIENPILIDLSIIMDPVHLNVSILPSKYVRFLEPCLQFMKENVITEERNIGIRPFEISKMERFMKYIEFGPDNNKALSRHEVDLFRGDLYLFVNEYDKRRGTNFLETFPEYTEFYKICKEAYENRVNITR